MNYQFNDGGRKAADYKGMTGDCVIRAIAIALELPYQEVYDALYARVATELPLTGPAKNNARRGFKKFIYHPWLLVRGWEWVPTMAIGSGCKVHLRADELPSGRIIARCSKHLVAVIDGTIHDNHDSSRNGTRCVYGYYRKASPTQADLDAQRYEQPQRS